MRKVLLLGSGGFIGRWILYYLLAKGYNVVGIGRKNRGGKDYQYLRLDVSSANAVQQFFDSIDDTKFDYIINCIGGGYVSTSTPEGREKLISFNLKPVEFVQGLLEEMKTVKKVVHLGSVSSYGVRLGEEINERSPKIPKTPHEVAKFEAEEKLKRVASKKNIAWIIFQPSQVYGPGDTGSDLAKLLRFVRNWKIFPIFGRGDNMMVPLVYVKDVAKLVVRAIEREQIENEEFILAWERISWNQFVKKVREHIFVLPIRVPGWICRSVVFVEDRLFKFLGIEPIFSYDRVDYVLGNRLYNSEKILSRFALQPTPLSEGLKETLKCLT